MKKRILSFILLLTMLISSVCVSVNAANGITVTLNGEELSFDTPPQIINGRTMVPLRAIFEALGASVEWDDSTKTVTASKKSGTTVKLTVDSSTMYVNGSAVTLDAPACIVDGRTLVPVRAISEAYNASVSWDEAEKKVSISNSNLVFNISEPGYMQAGYDKLKDAIIEKGLYDEEAGFYGISYDHGKNFSYTIIYDLETGEISLMEYYIGDDHTITTTVTITKNAYPEFLFYMEYDGEEFFSGGYFVNSEVVLKSGVKETGEYMKWIGVHFNEALRKNGINDVTMADLGIPENE